MRLVAFRVIVSLLEEHGIRKDYIIPDAFNEQVVDAAEKVVSEAAIRSGVSTLFNLR